MWRNSSQHYGVIAIALHWLVALSVAALFSLGLWMVELDYNDPWYRSAPSIHKGTGILLFIAMLTRLGWRLQNPTPSPEPELSRWEKRASELVHRLLYTLIFAVMLSGYLISTADGRAVDVFGLFSVPAIVSGLRDQADIAGSIHLLLAISLVSLAALHAAAALKHHFIDRDATLKRMLGIQARGRAPKPN